MSFQGTRDGLARRAGRVCLLMLAIGVVDAPPVWARAAAEGEAATGNTLLDEFQLALAAKRLCSGLWVSLRDREDVMTTTATTFLDERARQAVTAGDLGFVVDGGKRMVVAEWGGVNVRARFFGDQGCVILPAGSEDVFFTPLEVRSALPPAATLPWPMGDLPPENAPELELDEGRIDEALEIVFSEPSDHNAAFLAVHRGRIIAEGYGPGVDRDTQLESWSMGKSVTATLVGILIQEGRFGLWDPAPVPEWQTRPGDPRAAIRVADLLRMSSGLFFVRSEDPERKARAFVSGQDDHSLVYVAPIDVFQFSESRPLEHPPGTVGRYRNCDPLVLGSIVKRTVEAAGEAYLAWPQKALFDKIGIRHQVLETDAYGNFILTGFDFGTARNWARLGLLYLQDGVWNGQRLLPDGFVDFVSSPAPAWPRGEYGGLFWVGRRGLPGGAYSMRGAGGQEVTIVPSHDLVLVRLGHLAGAAGDFQKRLARAHALIVQAIEPGWQPPPG